MVLWWVCVSGNQHVLPGSTLPHCWGEGGRRHRDFAVRNPSHILQAKKLVTCTAGLPIRIPKSPFASACRARGRKENQLGSKHLVPAAAPCPRWCCTAPCPALHGRLAPECSDAGGFPLGWTESCCLPWLRITGGCRATGHRPVMQEAGWSEAGELSQGRGSVWERVALSRCPEGGGRSCCIIVWSNQFFLAKKKKKKLILR